MNKKMVEFVEKLKKIDENTLDTTDANNMIDYLMAKMCKKDTKNIDYETIEYLEYIRQKVAKCPYPDKSESIRDILIANAQAASLNKYHAMQMNSKNNIKLYDDMIERIDTITNLLYKREKYDQDKQKEER